MPHNDHPRRYPAKLLLFGEYAVVKGGSGLIMPFHKYHATWNFPDSNNPRSGDWQAESNHSLIKYHQWLVENTHASFNLILNLSGFAEDLNRGLYLSANIPYSYGTGSSGALVAAVYSRYAYNPLPATSQNFISLKSVFSKMEAFFHGKSSGLDPLCIYADTTILIRPDGTLQPVRQPGTYPAKPLIPFLLDSGVSANTHPLVENFLENMKNKTYRYKVRNGFNKLNDRVISRITNQGFSTGIMDLLQKLSTMETDLFSKMIPERIMPWWKRGLVSREYILKLLGSGGGGFILGFTPDLPHTKNIFRSTGFSVIEIFESLD